MISLEGLTLDDGPRARGGAASCAPSRTTFATGCCRTCFPTAATRASTTPPTRRSGSSTRSIATRSVTGDDALVERLLPIDDRHRRAPPRGHALRHRRRSRRRPAAPGCRTGYQLTWMDAKCDGWVVTPRRGKPVEINALWYNALCVLAGWTRRVRDPRLTAARCGRARGARTRVVQRAVLVRRGRLSLRRGRRRRTATSGSECRPNQVLAISLPHAVLDRSPLGECARRRRRRAGHAPTGCARSRPAARTTRRTISASLRDARRRVSPGNGVGLADRPVASTRGARCIPTTSTAPAAGSTHCSTTSAHSASARSPRSSTPRRRTRRAAAWRRRGASQRCCGIWSRS